MIQLPSDVLNQLPTIGVSLTPLPINNVTNGIVISGGSKRKVLKPMPSIFQNHLFTDYFSSEIHCKAKDCGQHC